MYSVWFSDLEKAIKAFHKRFPFWDTFDKIEGNAYGDFVIKSGDDTFIVKHTDFSVWKLERNWKNGQWVEVA